MIANESTFRALLRKGWDPVIIADRLLMGLARARSQLVLPLARAAARFVSGQEWSTFGYARLENHARERFGRSGRWVRDLKFLHESIVLCPALARAMTGEDGGPPLGTVAALIVGRVATPKTCKTWIDLARRVTVRELRDRARSAVAALKESNDRDPENASLPGGHSGSDDRSSQEGGNEGDASHGVLDEARESTSSETEDTWDAEHVTLRFLVPPSIGAAIEEARDLHRAVVGGEASVSEFIEAVLAETFAGTVTPMVNEGWIGARPSPATREKNLERKAEGWSFLRDVQLEGEEICEAFDTLEEAARLVREVESRSSTADSSIRSLLRLENDIEMRMGDLLSLMGESGAWRGLRFAGVGHYAEERLGISRSVAQARCRMSRILRERTGLREACENGRLGLEAASLVARALGGTGVPGGGSMSMQRAWIERAEESTIKRLREELRIVERDSALRNEGAAAAPVDDVTWHRSRSRRAGQTIDRLALLTEAAHANPKASLLIHFRLPIDLASMLRSAVDAERHRLYAICHEDGRSPSDDAAPGSVRVALMFSKRFGVVPEWCALLAMFEGFIRTWDDPGACPRRAADTIYIRDGYRCSAPGCTSRRNLEEHHIEYRSRGGGHSGRNRVTLCRFHHQQGEHQGLMRCRGPAPLGVLWSMGRLGVGGLFKNERSIEVARRRRHAAGDTRRTAEILGFRHTREDGLAVGR